MKYFKPDTIKEVNNRVFIWRYKRWHYICSSQLFNKAAHWWVETKAKEDAERKSVKYKIIKLTKDDEDCDYLDRIIHFY